MQPKTTVVLTIIRSLPKASAIALLACSLFGGVAEAQLTLSIDGTTPVATPGDTLDFTGVITNQTGSTLSSGDFFFNFFNYDPSALDPEQILGSTSFTLPNNTFSPDTDLFDLTIAPGTPSGQQLLGVTLEDVNGDISNEVDITTNVSAPAAAPEIDPSYSGAGLTFLLGVAAVLCGKRAIKRLPAA